MCFNNIYPHTLWGSQIHVCVRMCILYTWKLMFGDITAEDQMLTQIRFDSVKFIFKILVFTSK